MRLLPLLPLLLLPAAASTDSDDYGVRKAGSSDSSSSAALPLWELPSNNGYGTREGAHCAVELPGTVHTGYCIHPKDVDDDGVPIPFQDGGAFSLLRNNAGLVCHLGIALYDDACFQHLTCCVDPAGEEVLGEAEKREQAMHWWLDRGVAMSGMERSLTGKTAYGAPMLAKAAQWYDEHPMGKEGAFRMYKDDIEKRIEEQEALLRNGRDVNRLSVVDSHISAFYYGHRTYMGMAGLLLDKERNGRLWLERLKEEGVHPYATMDFDEPDQSVQMQLLESDPVMAAFAAIYRVENDRYSNAVLNQELWSQQPFEIDVYPRGDAEFVEKVYRAMQDAPSSDGSEPAIYDLVRDMVVEDLRVGHAGIFGMLKEMGITVPGLEAKLLKAKDCGIWSSEEVQAMMKFDEWIRLFGGAVNFFHAFDPTKLRSEEEVPDFFFRRMETRLSPHEGLAMYKDATNVNLRLVLDFKCHVNTEIPRAIVEVLNREYDVVISGVGSFYELDRSLGHIHQSSTNKIATRSTVDVLRFFFGVEDLQLAVDADETFGRERKVMVTASSLLKIVEGEKKSLLERAKGIFSRPEEGAPCSSQIELDVDKVMQLKAIREKAPMEIGLWTQEQAINAQAVSVIGKLLADERQLFSLGFALGADVTGEWPIPAVEPFCDFIGGRQSFAVNSKADRSFEAWAEDRRKRLAEENMTRLDKVRAGIDHVHATVVDKSEEASEFVKGKLDETSEHVKGKLHAAKETVLGWFK